MSETRKTVLIGDGNDERARILCEILEHEFNRQALVVEKFDALREALKDGENQDNSWKLVLVAADLCLRAYDSQTILPLHIYELTFTESSARFGIVYSATERPQFDFADSLHYLRVPNTSLLPSEREQIVLLLEQIGRFPRMRPVPKIRLAVGFALKGQVQSLDYNDDLDEGREILSNLIGRLNFSCNHVAIGKLSQGKSGSRVFWIRPRLQNVKNGEKSDWVLKMAPRTDKWKLELEINRHLAAQDLLNGNLNTANLLEIDKNKGHDDVERYSVEYRNWCAICYEFRGGRHSGFSLDLEAVINATVERWQFHTQKLTLSGAIQHAKPTANISRQSILEIILNDLCKAWYQNPVIVKRETRFAWSSENAPQRGYSFMPPYQLSSRAKREISELIEKRETEEIGQRYFANWHVHKQRLCQFIRRQPISLGGDDFFSRKIPIIISPVHGDMNVNNVLFQFRHARVVLIDFPSHQTSGHALQDFASLEVNLKYFLLDQQEWSGVSRLPALDHSHSQLPLWRELEKYALAHPELDEIQYWEQAQCDTASASLIWELLRCVRKVAVAVQSQSCNEIDSLPRFFDEYLHALLFYTVRAIRHPLTDAKRVLAIYSASEILRKLGFNPMS